MAPRKVKKVKHVDEAIVGRLLSVEYPTTSKAKDESYDALVVGYQSERNLHKLFYMEEGSTEAVDMRDRAWRFLSKKEVGKYGEHKLLFKRIAVRLAVGFLHDEVRTIPFEAFVVRKINEDDEMELIYTLSNHVENRKLIESGNNKLWHLLRPHEMEVDYSPIVAWSFYREHKISQDDH